MPPGMAMARRPPLPVGPSEEHHRAPVLETAHAGRGRWRKVDQSVHGNDFWQTDYDAASGTWEITYSVPLDTPGDERATRSFRFRAGR